jgi:hypothetical protein
VRGAEDLDALLAANAPMPLGGVPMEGRGHVLLRAGTGMGKGLPLWVCSSPQAQPAAVVLYFAVFTILVGMVIMSLFVGVITIGMFTECECIGSYGAVNLDALSLRKADIFSLVLSTWPLFRR